MDKIKEYLDHSKTKNFKELLFTYIDESHKKDSEIYKEANIDRKLFSKIRCTKDYIPRKNTVIKLCFSLKLDKNNFDNLLHSAGYYLTKSSEFDLIISYFIENKIYDIDIINESLYTYCNTIL